jgi:hypothetical protein
MQQVDGYFHLWPMSGAEHASESFANGRRICAQVLVEAATIVRVWSVWSCTVADGEKHSMVR